MTEKKTIKTTCKSCHGGCSVLVEVTDGVITHIEGNPDSTTAGTMCAKGLSSIQHVGHPDRLKYPLKRTGKRGEGKWQRISWDEALDTIAEKMKDSIAIIGLLDGELLAAGDNTSDVLNKMLAKIDLSRSEIITIYYGMDTEPTEAEQLSASIHEKYPQLQVEVVRGGQPYYNYIVSIE